MGASYDRPDAIELLDIVREFLQDEVQGAVDGQLSFHVRVAATALGIALRELRQGDEHAKAQTARLARFGCTDDTELAARIHAGELDDCYPDVAAAVRERVWAKLGVMNPGYAAPYTSADSRED
jgi:hypothetical protein